MIGAGAILSGVKAGLEWAWRRLQAPWNDVKFTAAMKEYQEDNWHAVSLRCFNDKPFEIQALTLRTIKPKGLPLRKNDGTSQQKMVTTGDSTKSLTLQWTIAEQGAVRFHPNCVIYVNLEGQSGDDFAVDFELMVILLDNRRSKKTIKVRTNPIKLATNEPRAST